MTKTPPMMCAVCGVVLDRWLDGWLHFGEVVGASDHVAVPVEYDESRMVARCDFCTESVALEDRWLLPAEDFQVPILGSWSSGGWLACPGCAGLIAEGRWDSVLDRHMNQRVATGTDHPGIRDWMVQLFDELRKHVLEPIRPFRPGDEASMSQED